MASTLVELFKGNGSGTVRLEVVLRRLGDVMKLALGLSRLLKLRDGRASTDFLGAESSNVLCSRKLWDLFMGGFTLSLGMTLTS